MSVNIAKYRGDDFAESPLSRPGVPEKTAATNSPILPILVFIVYDISFSRILTKYYFRPVPTLAGANQLQLKYLETQV